MVLTSFSLKVTRIKTFLTKTSFFRVFLASVISGTRLVVSVRGDEPYGELEVLKNIDATMILHDVPFNEDNVSRVHAARR